MKLKYTILYVEDVVKTLEFYENAFGLKTKMLHEGKDYGELETGTTILAFASLELMKNSGKSPAKAEAKTPTFEIAFETKDVKTMFYRAVKAGANVVQEERIEPWGQITSYVTDQNGFLIEICSPVSAQ